jgi:four helix bundle protein
MPSARRFDDLEIYKLAVELRRAVVKLTSTGSLAADVKLVSQLRDAVRGGARNIAEGYARGSPGEFARFLGYAKGSLDETRAHIDDACESGYVYCRRARSSAHDHQPPSAASTGSCDTFNRRQHDEIMPSSRVE